MTTKSNRSKYIFILLILSILVSLLMHVPNLKTEIRGAHNWRQSQTAWNIRNFVRHDANILNPRISNFNNPKDDNIYRYEFPIMQWSIAMVQKVFGEHVTIMRLSIFLLGAFTIIGFFFLLKALDLNDWSALIGAILLQFSPVFYYYSINPIPDNLALTGAVWYLYLILRYFKEGKNNYLIGASFCLLIATWAKLPFLMFSIVSIVYFLKQVIRQKNIDKNLWFFVAIQFLILIPAFAWYAWVMPNWEGNGILHGIFKNQVEWSETRRIIHYQWHVMFPQKLLNYIVLVPAILGLFLIRKNKFRWLVYAQIGITFLYLILEFNMIGTVHDYYMMPFLPWLYIAVAFFVEQIIKIRYVKYLTIPIIALSALLTFNYTKDFWSIEASYFNPDIYTYKKELQNAVPNDEKCIILDDYSQYIFSYAIDKTGYIYNNGALKDGWMNDLIRNKKNTYLYSDNRQIDENKLMQQYFDYLVLEAGSIRVYKLKTPEQLDEMLKN